MKISIVKYLFLALIIAVTLFFSAFVARLMEPWVDMIDWGKYGVLGIFFIAALINATIIVSPPIAVPVMVNLGAEFGIVPVILIYAAGATLGETTSYLLGRWGIKIVTKKEENPNGKMAWLKSRPVIKEMNGAREEIIRQGKKGTKKGFEKHKWFTIFFLSLQPVIPFDFGGAYAGSKKYSIFKFWAFCYLGRVPKYFLSIFIFHAFNININIWDLIFK